MVLLTSKLQTKYVVGLGVFLSGLLTILTPVVARTWGAYGVVITRIIIGVGQV